MIRKLIIATILLLLCGVSTGQTLEDYYEKIGIKLENDKEYLNLHYINLIPGENIPESLTLERISKDEPIEFLSDENISYRLIFLKDGIGLDSMYLLYIDEIRVAVTGEESFFGAVNAPSDDTTIVFKFKDMYNLKLNKPRLYNDFYRTIEKFLRTSDEPPGNLLRINPDDDIKTSLGVSSRDNTDYYNYVRTHGTHWYPAEEEQGGRRGRGGGAEKTPYRIDASFSHLSFSHEKMDVFLGGTSLELSLDNPVLNILPWQQTAIQAGFRVLFALSDGRDLNKASFLDTKIMARLQFDNSSIYQDLPFAFKSDSKINVGTGLIANFSFTRLGTLPFFNLYVAVGESAYTSPPVTVIENGENIAYHSFTQAEATMSFYWNTSDKLTSRFRLDAGIGYYDIYRATYNARGGFRSAKSYQTLMSPVVTLYYTWAPRNNPVLGSKIRVFDSRAKLLAWLKVLQFGNHSFRFETHYVSAPFARKAHQWEDDGGALFQIRYRYGLNN